MNASSSSVPVALVTGAARGIGLAITQWFLDHHYRVVMLDRDAQALALAQAETSVASPDRVLALVADVSDPQQVDAAVSRITTTWGRLDALVNNAGVAIFKPIEQTTFEDWRAVLATNLDGPFICTQACVPLMHKSGGGSIVNIASISGLRASTLRVAYGTSKAALLHLTRQQAVELGDVGIRVNAISPGPVDTEMAKQVHSPEIRAGYRDAIPLKRYGLPQEIAACVGFLCSAQAAYVNGQMLAVDGGFDAAGIGLPALRTSRS